MADISQDILDKIPAEYKDNPDKYQICKNGAVIDRERKRFVMSGVNRFDSESAKQIVAERWRKREDAVANGLKLYNSNYRSELDYFRDLGKAAAKNALTGQGIASVKWAELSISASGYDKPRELSLPGNGSGNVIQVNNPQVNVLLVNLAAELGVTLPYDEDQE